ncbi:MAG: GNAT family N-acetyltransferase [Myxococcota bacterium]
MKLLPLDEDLLPVAGEWCEHPENWKWLDFGAMGQALTPMALRVMVRRPEHEVRLFTDDEDHPAGIAALGAVNYDFGTAELWYLLGDKRLSGQGYTTRAVGALLDEAFGALGLESVLSWVVEDNAASARILERHGFRLVGRRRRCHRIGDRIHDRLYFDLLASEHGS